MVDFKHVLIFRNFQYSGKAEELNEKINIDSPGMEELMEGQFLKMVLWKKKLI